MSTPHLPKKVYVVPHDNDVKCGRGKMCFDHPGNSLLRIMVAFQLEEYRKQSTKTMKTKVINSVIADFAAQGARFLKLDRSVGLWYDGGTKAAKERIGSAFRDAIQPNKVKCMEKLKVRITNHHGSKRLKGLPMADHSPSGSGPHPAPSGVSEVSDAIRTYAPIKGQRDRPVTRMEMRKQSRPIYQGHSDVSQCAISSRHAAVCQVKNNPMNAVSDESLFLSSSDVVSSQPLHASNGEVDNTIFAHDEPYSLLELWRPNDEANSMASIETIDEIDDFDDESIAEDYSGCGYAWHITRRDRVFLASLDWTKLRL